jgi:hypothetical protein
VKQARRLGQPEEHDLSRAYTKRNAKGWGWLEYCRKEKEKKKPAITEGLVVRQSTLAAVYLHSCRGAQD